MTQSVSSGGTAHFTFEQALEKAAELGLRVLEPMPDELFIDIDTDEDYEFFLKQLDTLREYYVVEIVRDEPSKSGLPHRYVVVRVPGFALSNLQRIALQAALGSDRKRELLSWVQATLDTTHAPTLFFERAA